MIPDLLLAAAIICAWWLGVFSMALWQSWRARPAEPVPPQWLPRPLSEHIATVEASEREQIDSPFAPKPKPKRKAAELRQRLEGLKHWPKAEIPRRQDKCGTAEGAVDSPDRPPQTLPKIERSARARGVLPSVEWERR